MSESVTKSQLFTSTSLQVGTNVFDKDGISGAATLLQMAAYLHSKNSNLLNQLNEIYKTYGFHYSLNSYYICHDPNKISRIFNRVADLNGPNSVSLCHCFVLNQL